MDPAVFEIAFIFLLIAANGIFAMSEIAVVSAERLRLQQRADAGDVGARRALELVKSPSRFFSTIQLGITSIGILAGVIGGATLASRFATWLSASVLAAWADTIAIGTVVVAITYVSLVVGELVPKRIGLGYAEQIAVKLAPTMHWFSRVAAPAVTVLSFSTDAVLRLLRARQAPEPAVTEEGIKRMLEQATLTGVVEPAEREMVERVFRLGDRLVTDIMTPYPDIIWLDLADSRGLSQRKVTTSGHSHFPVIRDRRDNIAGIVHAKDLVIQSLAGHPLDLESALQTSPFRARDNSRRRCARALPRGGDQGGAGHRRIRESSGNDYDRRPASGVGWRDSGTWRRTRTEHRSAGGWFLVGRWGRPHRRVGGYLSRPGAIGSRRPRTSHRGRIRHDETGSRSPNW
jgi:putative hemolysin